MSNVQIPERLLLELYQLHVLHRKPPVVDEEYIKSELTKKFEAWQRRVDYAADLERGRRKNDQTYY